MCHLACARACFPNENSLEPCGGPPFFVCAFGVRLACGLARGPGLRFFAWRDIIIVNVRVIFGAKDRHKALPSGVCLLNFRCELLYSSAKMQPWFLVAGYKGIYGQ